MTDADDGGAASGDETPTPAERARHVWSIGSYASIGRDFLPMAAHLVRAADVEASDRVLDVACGTGNVAIIAARRGAGVTGLDITPSMLEAARENAATAGVEAVDWRQGDAVDLPFEDDAFDVALSCVGHMFAEPPGEAADELLRVTRPGGRIAFTSWTPRSVVPAMAKVMQASVPPDPDPSPPPFAWGDPEVVRERLGEGVVEVDFETGTLLQPTLSPEHTWLRVSEDSGMFIVALEGVDPDDRPALREEMLEAVRGYFDDGESALRMEYRVTTATVR